MEAGRAGGRGFGRSSAALPVPASYQDALVYSRFQMLGLMLVG